MVAQQSKPRKMSVAEFMALPDDGNRHELVRGELRVMPPPKGSHGLIELALVGAIDRYLDERARAAGWDIGQGLKARDRLVGFAATGEVGLQFTLPDDPKQIRGADGVYVPAAQLAQVTWDGVEYFPTVPHLVIEIMSASETASDMSEKVDDYLAGGARRVWYVDPRRRAVYVHDADAPTRLVHWGDALSDHELLPGMTLPLTSIFREP